MMHHKYSKQYSKKYLKYKIQPKQGFTLLELMCTLGIIAILSVIAVQQYTSFLHKYQQRSVLENLSQQIKMAKRFAFSEKVDLVLQANNGDWANGWSLFQDRNNNQIQEANEPTISQRFERGNNTTPSLRTILDTTGGCMAFGGQGIVQRCGIFQNLVLNARVIFTHVDYLQGTSQNTCAHSSSLTILRHRTASVCTSRNYSAGPMQHNRSGFSGNCTC